ncbi:ankyrin repeat-containing domain protein [Cercophora scortea]|uniref:Ankyrin repeat-containing domain protein n=1 Tax=Cercophora scortea TaxID=314031 RepID=A0AAE0IXH3_9PEZI|nr:ankyrin repeat-containing domain protein [Cercophora scortea]
MDPLSLAASIAGLAGTVATVVSITYQYGSSVLSASQSRKNFLKELQTLRTTLQQLEGIVADEDAVSRQFTDASASLGPAVDECTAELNRLQEKLQQVVDGRGMKGVMHRLIWPLTEKDTLRTMGMLERYRGLFQLGLSVDTWKLLSETFSGVVSIKKTQEFMQRDSKSHQLLDWLSNFDYRAKHAEVVRRRVPDTGRWLLESPEFTDFIKCDAGSQMLWCYGLPGAGKSVVSSMVIDHILEISNREGGATLYWYFDYLKASEQHPDAIAAAILRQLIEHLPAMPREVQQLYDQCERFKQRPGVNALLRIAKSLVVNVRPTFIIIDAMDECDEDYRNGIFTILESLQAAGVHVFVTARPHIEYLEYPENGLEIQAHEEDIRRLFQFRLQSKGNGAMRRIMTASVQEEIVSAIVAKADGMFLWAALQIDEVLKQKTRTMIRKALQDMPTDVYGVFDRTLSRIGDDDLARRTLHWLARAKEPLDFPALAHALSIDLEDPPFDDVDEDNIPSIEVLCEVCCGLVTAGGAGNLRFVHFTVQEYFEAHPEKLYPLCDVDIAKSCLTYLSLGVFESGYCDSKSRFRARLKRYPFLLYAARRWYEHVGHDEQDQIEDMILNIYRDDKLFSSYCQAHYGDRIRYDPKDKIENSCFDFQKRYSPIHNAAELCLPGITRRLLAAGSDPSAQTLDHKTPLYFAVINNDLEMTKILHAAGADASIPSSTTISFDHTDGAPPSLDWQGGRRSSSTTTWCPLTIAGLVEYTEIFDVLSVDAGPALLGNVLGNATQYGDYHADLARKILRMCPELDDRHPLFRAAIDGSLSMNEFPNNLDDEMYPSILSVLLEERPALDDSDGFLTGIMGRPGLPENVIKTLLLRGVKPSALSRRSWAALQTALEADAELVRILQDKLQEDGGDAVTSSAVADIQSSAVDLSEIVDILDKVGCNINENPDGASPLAAAAVAGRTDLMALLIRHGAEMESRPQMSNRTPLMEAAKLGLVEPTKVLIAMGADVNSNGERGTPLITAAHYGQIELVRLLLDHGADVNLVGNDDDRYTALYQAAAFCEVAICKLLLDRGADPNLGGASDQKLGSPLMAAIGQKNRSIQTNTDWRSGVYPKKDPEEVLRDQTEIVNLLLDHGADPNFRHPSGCDPGHRAEGYMDSSFPLELAVSRGSRHFVDLLLARGADISMCGGVHGSLVHAALMTDKGESNRMARYLLELGATIVEGDERYGGVLHLAHPSDFALLVAHRADVNAKGGYYGNPLQTAILGQNFPMNQPEDSRRERLEAVRFLVEHGADVNAEGGQSCGNSLQAAARHGYKQIVAYLIDHGADMNPGTGSYGNVLQAAARSGIKSIVSLVLDRGAAASCLAAVGGYYGTCLQAAAVSGKETIVELLLDQGADVNQSGGVFGSALHAAAYYHHEAVVKLLLAHGADANIRGGRLNETPLKLFKLASRLRRTKDMEVVERVFAEHGAVETPELDEVADAMLLEENRAMEWEYHSQVVTPYASDDED